MKVFISWSGERSHLLAEALREWLPDVIQALRPWLSASDIEKGTRWSKEVATQLHDTNAGIICLTRENLTAPWINFEAGALSKSINESFVCPYLLDLKPSEVSGPLSQFQLTVSNRDDTFNLVKTLNKALGISSLSEAKVERSFERYWDELEKKIGDIRATEVDSPAPRRTGEEILEEVLVTVRAISRTIGETMKSVGDQKTQDAGPIDKDNPDNGEPKSRSREDTGSQEKAESEPEEMP